jgi:hypothetical protein
VCACVCCVCVSAYVCGVVTPASAGLQMKDRVSEQLACVGLTD